MIRFFIREAKEARIERNSIFVNNDREDQGAPRPIPRTLPFKNEGKWQTDMFRYTETKFILKRYLVRKFVKDILLEEGKLF